MSSRQGHRRHSHIHEHAEPQPQQQPQPRGGGGGAQPPAAAAAAQQAPEEQLGAEEEALPVLDAVEDYEKIKRIGEGTFGIVCEWCDWWGAWSCA